MVEKEYVLGCDRAELARLEFQHTVWASQTQALWERAGLGRGQTVLDLGCGPGFTSIELARTVGPTGSVIARDQSAAFLHYLQERAAAERLDHLSVSRGPAQDLAVPNSSLDVAYSRWLLCWLPDASIVVEKVARALRPGGCFVLQEYLDWGAMKLIPRQAAFDRAVEACLNSWLAAQATIDVVERLPPMLERCGLDLEYMAPKARCGPPGSLEWRWIQEFMRDYLPKVEALGLISPTEVTAARRLLDDSSQRPSRSCVTPTVAEVIARKR